MAADGLQGLWLLGSDTDIELIQSIVAGDFDAGIIVARWCDRNDLRLLQRSTNEKYKRKHEVPKFLFTTNFSTKLLANRGLVEWGPLQAAPIR